MERSGSICPKNHVKNADCLQFNLSRNEIEKGRSIDRHKVTGLSRIFDRNDAVKESGLI